MGCIAKLFEESRDVAGIVTLPCHERDSFHKIVSRRELFGDEIFDPVFDLRCDLVVRRWIERAESAICVSIDRIPQDTAPTRCLPFDRIGVRHPGIPASASPHVDL